MDEADEIPPDEAMLDGGDRALIVERPYLVQNRLEADAMLIDGPHFDSAVRESSCHLPQQGTETLFEVALCRWISRDVAWTRLAPVHTDSP